MNKSVLSILLYFSSLLFASSKYEGIILKKNDFEAFIALGQNLIIYKTNNEKGIEGKLIEVSNNTIFFENDQTVLKRNIESLKANAVTNNSKNFLTGAVKGFGLGALFSIGFISYLKPGDGMDIWISYFVVTPFISSMSGLIGGLAFMSNNNDLVRKTDVFEIGKNNWIILD